MSATLATLRQLASPMVYLRIQGGWMKFLVDFGLPAVLAGLGVAILLGLDMRVLGSNGLVHYANELLQMLVGFFVASLAAISTFPSRSLAQDVIGMQLKGQTIKRRQYLSYMFANLAAVGLIAYVAGAFGEMGKVSIRAAVEGHGWTRSIILYCYIFVLSHILTVGLQATYYLADRIHRADGEVVPAPESPAPKNQ